VLSCRCDAWNCVYLDQILLPFIPFISTAPTFMASHQEKTRSASKKTFSYAVSNFAGPAFARRSRSHFGPCTHGHPREAFAEARLVTPVYTGVTSRRRWPGESTAQPGSHAAGWRQPGACRAICWNAGSVGTLDFGWNAGNKNAGWLAKSSRSPHCRTAISKELPAGAATPHHALCPGGRSE
jgi:hypothetical protein